MPEISIQRTAAELDNLEDCESFGEPVGDLPRQTAAGFYEENGMYAGTWDCEPGTLMLDLEITEFCHLLEGHWKLTSESGQVTEIRPGDSWIFPKGWKGTSEVIEKVRKIYMIIE